MRFSAIRHSQKLLLALLTCFIGGQHAAAQQTTPAPKDTHPQSLRARVVSIWFSVYGGTCECCGGNQLQVKPGAALLLVTFARECYQQDSQKYRDLRVDADLSDKHWHALQRLVDHDALFALPDHNGCASCYDDLDELIEVKFADHSDKSVTFPAASPPKELSALSEALLSLETKLQKELPNRSSANTIENPTSAKISATKTPPAPALAPAKSPRVVVKRRVT